MCEGQWVDARDAANVMPKRRLDMIRHVRKDLKVVETRPEMAEERGMEGNSLWRPLKREKLKE